MEKLFKSFKEDLSVFKNQSVSNKCEPLTLKNYFYEHFRDKKQLQKPKELSDIPTYISQIRSISDISMNTDPQHL